MRTFLEREDDDVSDFSLDSYFGPPKKKRRMETVAPQDILKNPALDPDYFRPKDLLMGAGSDNDEVFFGTLDKYITNKHITTVPISGNMTLLAVLLHMGREERFLATLELFYRQLQQEDAEIALMMVIAWAYQQSVSEQEIGATVLAALPNLLDKGRFARKAPCRIDETTSLGFSIFHAFALNTVGAQEASLKKAIKQAYHLLVVTAFRTELLIDARGRSPLYVAFQTKRTDIIEIIYQNLNTNLFEDLRLAYDEQYTSFIQFLNERAVDVHTAVNPTGDTLLHVACQTGAQDFVVRLLKLNPYPYAYNHAGLTPADLLPISAAALSTLFTYDYTPYAQNPLFPVLLGHDIQGVEYELHDQIQLASLAALNNNFYCLRKMQERGMLETLLRDERVSRHLSESILRTLCLAELMSVSYHFQNEEEIQRFIEQKSFVLQALLLARIDFPLLRPLMNAYIDHLFTIDDGETLLACADFMGIKKRIRNVLKTTLQEKRFNVFTAYLTSIDPLADHELNVQEFNIILQAADAERKQFILLLANKILVSIKDRACFRNTLLGCLLDSFLSNDNGAFLNTFIEIVPHFFSLSMCVKIIHYCTEPGVSLNLPVILRVLRLMPQFPEWENRSLFCQRLLERFYKNDQWTRHCTTAADWNRMDFLLTVLLKLEVNSEGSATPSFPHEHPQQKLTRIKKMLRLSPKTALEDIYNCQEEYNARVAEFYFIRHVHMCFRLHGYSLPSLPLENPLLIQFMRLPLDVFLPVSELADIKLPSEDEMKALMGRRTRTIDDVVYMCDRPYVTHPLDTNPSEASIEAEKIIEHYLAIHQASSRSAVTLPHCYCSVCNIPTYFISKEPPSIDFGASAAAFFHPLSNPFLPPENETRIEEDASVLWSSP